MKRGLRYAFLVAAPLLGLTACPPPPPSAVYVRVAPPSPQVEFLQASPGPDFVWVRGYHRFDGGAYVWVPGAWKQPPHARAVWKAGRWKKSRHGWRWVEGRWR